MQAGFARIVITPRVGARMFGWGSRDDDHGCEGAHDDIHARALWMRDGNEDVLTLGFDLLFFNREIADRLRDAIGIRFALAPRQILLNTSHTHNGPTTGTWWTALYQPPDTVYLDELERRILSLAEQARDALTPVMVFAGETTTSIALSRRKLNADGQAEWIANDENTIYTSVPVCLLRDVSTDMPVCLLFSVSCHPSTVPGHLISADYPGVAMRELDAHFGTCSMFLQGVGGDTKVRAADGGMQFGTTWVDQESAGRHIAESISGVINRLERVEATLTAVETEMTLATHPVRSRDEFALIRDDSGESEIRRLWAGRFAEKLDRGQYIDAVVPITMHGVQIGTDVRLVGVEAEATAEVGNLIADFFGGGVTFPMGYTDGCQLYLPLDRMLPQGGYEVTSAHEYGFPSNLARGIDGALNAGLDTLRRAGIT
jgi:neutral ceramidase